jgi:hypothetical protein
MLVSLSVSLTFLFLLLVQQQSRQVVGFLSTSNGSS